jgi:hypothetical protein
VRNWVDPLQPSGYHAYHQQENKKNTGNKVTLKHFRETIVAVQKQYELNIVSLWARVALIQHAKSMRRIISSMGRLVYFST